MNSEPFASSTVSLILAWIFAVPALFGILAGAMGLLLEQAEDEIPRWFVLWIMLCILVFSPFRYFVLQLIIATAFPVQSVGAFLSLLLLSLYIPIVFGLLYGIGIVLPLFVSVWLAFGGLKAPKISMPRLMLGALLTPFTLGLGYVAFFWLLQYGAMSVHWLRASDVIGATNGPALASYSVALKHFLPLPISGIYTEVTQNDTDMLRNHVASFYLGRQAEARYVREAYPALYQSLTSEP
ncbi:MAG: hypothetical protein WEA80_04485 [Gemmatimonadaceae bacterium]